MLMKSGQRKRFSGRYEELMDGLMHFEEHSIFLEASLINEIHTLSACACLKLLLLSQHWGRDPLGGL